MPKSHIKGKELRLQTRGEYEELKNRILLDYPDLGYTSDEVVPVLGNAGDLIIFDTDLFHLGGVVKENNERFEDRLNQIKLSFNDIGFNNTANIYSISQSSKFGGNLGWVSENSLSKKISDVLFDDIFDTGGTIAAASRALIERGAKSVSVAATHGIFSDESVEKLKDTPID